MGQCPHFIGNHRKPATGFTGACRFNRRVQGQQVGLVGQAANHVQHFANIARFIRQLANQRGGGLHVAAHALDGADGFLYQVTAVAGRGGGVA